MHARASFCTRSSAGLLAFGLTLLPVASRAAELPDCHVNATASGSEARSPAHFSLVLDGALKNGVVLAYAKDDAILNTPVKVVRTTAGYTVAGDMKLHSSWALNPDYRFAAGQTLKVSRQLILRDGRTFDQINLANGSILFVNDQGEFCNSAGKVDNPINLVGTLAKVPDDAAIARTDLEEPIALGSLRVIYGGTSAGAMHFQEVWVQGTRIVQTQDRVFDQFATQIEIAGLKLDVSEPKADSVKVSYNVPSRSEISMARVRDIPIHGTGN